MSHSLLARCCVSAFKHSHFVGRDLVGTPYLFHQNSTRTQIITMANFYNSDIDIRSFSSILQHLPTEDIENFLNDPNNIKVDSIVKDLPQVKALELERERLIQENKKIAESNLSFESTYCRSREELIKALQECQQMKDELDKKKSKLRELSRQNSLDTTLALMQAAMAEAEEASEEVANSFTNNQTSIEDFLKDFIEKRKLYHSRRIKAEKMPEEISKLNSSGALQPTRPAPPPPTLPFSQMQVGNENSAPYPTTNPFAPFISAYQPNNPYNYH